MKIKQVAETLHVSQKTIRYYEECDLITPRKEQKMGRVFRDYDEELVERLQTIVILRKFRFSLEDIRTMLDTPDSIAELCHRHHDNMVKEIGAMTQMCNLLAGIVYTDIVNAQQLSQEMEKQRREMIQDEYFADYDLSHFDEEFTDQDLYRQKQEEHREFQRTVAAGYFFANPRVKSNLSGSSPSSPR